ncbi:MAG: TonB-dependent receptor [Gammaproteobacteria bacterium]|jgi:iron complex outermembrane recepter protein|nr:TonB-dependent receptor [Gammaproteobacteria bacterium]
MPVKDSLSCWKGLLLGAAVCTSMTAFAAEEATLEEIVVTGTKRTTSMQDTPLAVSTLTAGMISNTFVNDIRAVADLTPNVLLTKQPGFNAVAGGIRGTGSTSILVMQDTSVGITVDDFGIGSVQSQFIELFDVQQAEIYRGPQGTLFGKNSTGGVIAITTKQPDLQEYGGDIEFTYGQYDGARTADAIKITASMDIPIIENVLGLRFAGVHDSHEGWMTNSKDTATFPEVIPIFAAFGLPSVNPPLPPELDVTNTGNGEELDEKEVIAFKTKLLWKPTDNYQALFTWEYSRDNSGSPTAVNETPQGEGFLWDALGFPGTPTTGFNDVYDTGQSRQGNGINIANGHTVDVDGFYLTQTLDLGDYTIKALLGQRETEETLPSTYTGEAFNNLFDASRNLEREQQQFEVRVVSNYDGDFNFVAGIGYTSDDVEFRSIATQGLTSIIPSFNTTTGSFYDERGYINLNLDGINDPGVASARQDRESMAYYFDGTWNATDEITVSAGIRYTKDEKEFGRLSGGGGPCNQYTQAKDAVLIDAAQPFSLANCARDNRSTALSRAGMTGNEYDPRQDPLPASAFVVNINAEDEWTDTTWRLVVDYKFADNQMVYGSISTGFISGGFTETCSTIVTCVAYAPEENTNFEIGHKGDFLNNTLRINTAIFYTEYENLQRNQVVPFTDPSGNPAQETLTVNAGESTHYGLEVEVTWLASENLTIRGGLGILEAEYDEFEWDPQPNNPATGITDFSSLDIPFSAPMQFNIDATYDWPLNNGGSMELNVNANFQDEAEGSPFDTNAAAAIPAVIRHPSHAQIEERTLVNASITYRPASDNFYISAFGQNLTDENTRIGANSVGALWVMSFFSPPRQLGIRFGTRF